MSLSESDKNKGSRPRDARSGATVPDDDGLGDITRGRKVPFRIDPPVFWPSVVLILGFVA